MTAPDAPEGNNYLGMSCYNGKETSRSFGSADGPLSVTFYMKTVGGSDYWNFNAIYILSSPGNGQLGMIIRGDSVECGSASYATTSGTWYQHELSIRPDSVNGGTFDWYVNGQLVASNQAFGDDALLPCATFYFLRAGNDANLECFIDDIRIGKGQDRLPAPTFTPGSPYVFGSKKITIQSPTPGAQIYYTTDGSLPVVGGTLYAGLVTV